MSSEVSELDPRRLQRLTQSLRKLSVDPADNGFEDALARRLQVEYAEKFPQVVPLDFEGEVSRGPSASSAARRVGWLVFAAAAVVIAGAGAAWRLSTSASPEPIAAPPPIRGVEPEAPALDSVPKSSAPPVVTPQVAPSAAPTEPGLSERRVPRRRAPRRLNDGARTKPKAAAPARTAPDSAKESSQAPSGSDKTARPERHERLEINLDGVTSDSTPGSDRSRASGDERIKIPGASRPDRVQSIPRGTTDARTKSGRDNNKSPRGPKNHSRSSRRR